MSLQSIGAVLDVRGIKGPRKLVLAVLCEAMDEATGECCLTQKQIMELVNCSQSTLNVHLRGLEDAGFISRETERLGRGRGLRTTFTFPFLNKAKGAL